MSDEIQQNVILIVSLGEDASSEEINKATTQLYRELKKSDADSVQKVRSDKLEKGAKGDPITFGTIALELSIAVVPVLISMVNDWLKHRYLDTTTVKFKVGDSEVEFPIATSSSPEEIEILTGHFVALLKAQQEEEE